MAELLGFDGVQQRFAEAMQQNRLHHAWLLYGMKGIGKAKLAAALRNLFLCENPDLQRFEACGVCHHCLMLGIGSHPDAQSVTLLWNSKKKRYNRDINIEQMRDALTFLEMSGLKSKRRVLLIDDTGLMNTQAANALLKGLEEPSDGSLLLIVCHDLLRLPATIRSRCMLQACSPLTDKTMKYLLQEQGLNAQLHELALVLGQGSLGRVQVLQEPEHAKALLDWQLMIADLGKSDIGRVQQWLDKYVKSIPHDLIASMLLIAVQQQALEAMSWDKSEAIYQASLAVGAWPKEVIRHTLRPAPSLLAYILQLRNALKMRL